MDDFDITHGPAPALDAVEEVRPQFLDVLSVRFVQLGLFVQERLALVARIKGPAGLPGHVEGALSAVEITADVLPFFGLVAGVLPVLPDRRERLELERRDLGIWRVGVVALDGAATCGEDAPRPFLLGPPEDL